MNTQLVHEKRRKNTSLKKADFYRKEAAFHRQRSLALVKDIRGLGGETAALYSALDGTRNVLKKTEEQLRADVIALEVQIAMMKKIWLVRVALKLFGNGSI